MSITIVNLQPYWASQASLTALIPASNVWVDVPGDVSSLPYALFSQVGSPKYTWTFKGGYIQRTKFKISVYAATLASIDTITQAVIAAFKWQLPTSITLYCRLDNIIPAAEKEGAYVSVTEWTLAEVFQS